MAELIPFNKPTLVGRELLYMADAILSGHTAGQGKYTKMCEQLLQSRLKNSTVMLTNSCTSALEMSSLALGLGPGDEVIVPSYTFVSTANAFYKFGVKPVFCDVRREDLNLDVGLVEGLITPQTKAVVPVHYAGVPVEMGSLKKICDDQGIHIIEDAAHCDITSTADTLLGMRGTFGTFSFHETKNFNCGEGGALIVNQDKYVESCEIIREKGTNRGKFLRGDVDKYSWVSAGSSYVMSDLLAAFLFSQLEDIDEISRKRHKILELYMAELADLVQAGDFECPIFTKEGSAHMFYILADNSKMRDDLIQFLRKFGIHAVFHYIPLHASKVGRELGYAPSDLPVSLDISERLVRLPFFFNMTEAEVKLVAHGVRCFFTGRLSEMQDLVEQHKTSQGQSIPTIERLATATNA